jgi:flagellar M-ring protein FliF
MLPPPTSEPAIGSKIGLLSEDGAEAAEGSAAPTAASAREKAGQARALAQQDPKVVANIIKEWTAPMPADDGIEKAPSC